MNARVEEDLVGVDVADPGDETLVEEEALDAAFAALDRRREVRERDLERLRAAGVEGLEVHHVDHNPSVREKYLRIAEALDLVPTAGSDYHGEAIAPERHLGDVTMSHEDLTRLEKRRP